MNLANMTKKGLVKLVEQERETTKRISSKNRYYLELKKALRAKLKRKIEQLENELNHFRDIFTGALVEIMRDKNRAVDQLYSLGNSCGLLQGNELRIDQLYREIDVLQDTIDEVHYLATGKHIINYYSNDSIGKRLKNG